MYKELELERVADPTMITMNAQRTSQLDCARVNDQLSQQRTDMKERSFKVVRLQLLSDECYLVLLTGLVTLQSQSCGGNAGRASRAVRVVPSADERHRDST